MLRLSGAVAAALLASLTLFHLLPVSAASHPEPCRRVLAALACGCSGCTTGSSAGTIRDPIASSPYRRRTSIRNLLIDGRQGRRRPWTRAAFFCVTASICVLIIHGCTPADCRGAVAISATIAVTFHRGDDVAEVPPALLTSCTPRGPAYRCRRSEPDILDAADARRASARTADDSEAASRIARPGRFHRRVERQKVRLEGNFLDQSDDAGNLPRR